MLHISTHTHTHTDVWENVTLTQTHELKHNYAYNKSWSTRDGRCDCCLRQMINILLKRDHEMLSQAHNELKPFYMLHC